jgi:3-hydroxyisobutyrate dehydrogenase-like beta-hydroxyacid dehydrogenase
MAASGAKAETIAIIGAGEMGTGIGRRLHEKGARVVTEVKGRSAASVARVRSAGLETIDNDAELVREAAFILSIVPPGVALQIAERFREPMSRADSKPVFVECNAIAPATTRRIENLLAGTGCRFIDAGICGVPPPSNVESSYKGPRIYASGTDAYLLEQLNRYGLDIAVIAGPIGAASGLKLLHSGVTKGLSALGAAMVAAAARNGLAEAFRNELARSQPEILSRLDRFVPQVIPKAYRWVAEMEELAEFVGSDNEGAMIYRGVAQLCERIAAEVENRAPADGLSALTAFYQQRR